MRQWLGRLVLFNQVSIQAKLHNTFTSLNHQASFTFQETDENIWNSSSVALLLEEVMEIKYSNFFSSNTSDKKRNDEHIHSSWREHTHNYAHNDCDDSFSCHQFFDMNKKIRTLRCVRILHTINSDKRRCCVRLTTSWFDWIKM